MNSSDLLSELASKIYEPPLSTIRDSGAIADVSNPLCVLMLLIDFDTEVAINGIVDFIGNSTGLYARETVLAFDRLGCPEEAKALARILSVAQAVGMTHESIQKDRSSLSQYAITSFTQLHGKKWKAACTEIETIRKELDMRRLFDRAEQFLEQHRALFEEALGLAPKNA